MLGLALYICGIIEAFVSFKFTGFSLQTILLIAIIVCAGWIHYVLIDSSPPPKRRPHSTTPSSSSGQKAVTISYANAVAAKSDRESRALQATIRSVERERSKTETLVHAARTKLVYEVARQQHYASFSLADLAYAQNKSIRSHIDAIDADISKIAEARAAAARARAGASGAHRRNLHARVEALDDVLNKIRQGRNILRLERERLLKTVNQLNEQTALLRDAIRDHCGTQGRQWYARLEARKSTKKPR